MLQAIRERAGSVIVKVLFFLLIASFAVWGIGDIFRQKGGETTVITVGDRKIRADQLQQAFRDQLERLRQVFPGGIDTAQAKALGVLDQTIDQIVLRELLDLEAQRLGLALGDDAIRQAIQTNPAFHGPDGRFDRRIYSMTLSNARMTETQFEAQLRQDLIRQHMLEAFTSGVPAPTALADALYRARNERRVADYVLIPLEAAGDVGKPSEADLAEVYERNLDRFRTPEYRGFTAVVITPESMAKEIQIPEERLREEYEMRQAEFEKPERRQLEQLLFEDEEKAKAASASLKAGKSFEEVAKEFGAEASQLGDVVRADLPQEIGDVVFELPQNQSSEPVKTAFGWHILRVTGIEPGGVPPFEAVRDQIRDTLAEQQASDRLFELANEMEDALAGGATVEEVATKFNLKPVKVDAADPDGNTPDGQPVDLGAALPDAVRTVFETPQGQASRVLETRDGTFYLVHVDSVTPAGTKPQAEVTDVLREIWLNEKRSAAVEQQAKALAGTLGEAKPLSEAAKEKSLEVQTSAPFLRNGQGAEHLPGSVVGRIFEAAPHGVVTGQAPAGWYVAQLKSVERPDPAKDPAALDSLARQLQTQLRGDVAAELQQALRARYTVEIKREEIDRFF